MRRLATILAVCLLAVLGVCFAARAGAPSGDFWFQMFTQTQTGSDNTGDGGTGLPADLNYYYVGQSWTTRVDVNIDSSYPSNGADLIINYDKDVVTAATPTALSAYQYWTGEEADNTAGQVTISGYNNAGVYYSGQRQYANITWTAVKPTAASYGTTSGTLNIDYTSGVGTDSNIARDGTDYMDSEEDFDFIVWADTQKPYAQSASPANGATGVSVSANYTFEMRDSKNGEGDDTGVGTGVYSAVSGRQVDVGDGSATTSYGGTDYCSYSGTWQSVCDFTVNPSSPAGISGDSRNWEYNTTYTVAIGGFKDKASTSQNQLGDANGPNTMDTKVWTFTTEADTAAPTSSAASPTAGASGVAVSAEVWVDVLDKKSASVSGSGVVTTTCRISISAPSWGSAVVYSSTSTEATVEADPTDYGLRFKINPAVNFGENETVSVSVYDCQDAAGNTMVTYNYTFGTTDGTVPVVGTLSPANDASAAADTNISFHVTDSGVGVDLSNTIIYINGDYYTSGGGAGSVSIDGATVSFADSVDFTSFVSGTADDYTFDINPATDFTAGEAVPVIIYTRDLSGNVADRYVYAFTVEGAGCAAGSTYCGSNTTWNGTTCVGTGGGSGGGGAAAITPAISDERVSVAQIDEDSVLVSWYSNVSGKGSVVYDTVSPADYGVAPNFSYRYVKAGPSQEKTFHQMQIDGLKGGTLYYFRPVTLAGGKYARGSEVMMAPKYAPAGATPSVPAGVSRAESAPASIVGLPLMPVTAGWTSSMAQVSTVRISDIVIRGGKIKFSGKAEPNKKIKFVIY